MKPTRKIIGGSFPRIVYHDKHGKLHREDGPACIYLNGLQFRHKHGMYCQTSIRPDGTIDNFGDHGGHTWTVTK